MRLICTADWQTRFQNLPESERAADRILELCVKHRLEAIAVAGDIKHHYNPLDFRIIDFWQKFIGRLRDKNVLPLMVLGNHDRIGLYQDERNWLSILKNAGAQVFDTADVVNFKEGRVHILPFTGTPERLEKETKWLKEQKPNPKKDILIFHQTISGAKFNKTAIVESGQGIPLSALRAEQYKYCIGGDIHLPQRVAENVWYTGSPFPMDWGEVNQQKVFAIVTPEGLSWVSTGAPGRYDESVKGFKAPASWEGALLRVKVPVTPGDDYHRVLEQAKQVAQKTHPGAQITVIPDVLDPLNSSLNGPSRDLPEATHIKSYIRQVMEADSEGRADEMEAYIEYKLRQTGQGLRLDSGVQFRKGWAEKFLCFDKLEMDFTGKGITVVSGVNQDRPGRSNGAGKTSLLQIIPVALFGRTFKDQTHDGWVQRGSKGTTRVGLEFSLADGSIVKVERTRNPVAVHLWVNGNEISSGGKSTDVAKDIETLSGYTWDTFSTLVYLGSDELDFLWGTQKQKQEMLSKLQNLERFGAAQKIVRADVAQTIAVANQKVIELDLLREQLVQIESMTDNAGEVKRVQIALIDVRRKLKSMAVSSEPSRSQVDEWSKFVEQASKKCGVEKTDCAVKVQAIEKLKKLGDKCFTCGHKIDPKKVQEDIQNIRAELQQAQNRLATAETAVKQAVAKFEHEQGAYLKAKEVRAVQLAEWRMCTEQEKALVGELARWQGKVQEQANQVSGLQASKKAVEAAVECLMEIRDFQKQAESILARDGLPAYLGQLLCPRLNGFSRQFSELFTDGELQVQFRIIDGEVQTEVVNPYGGEGLKDQSEGEGRIAALITSFAMREASPKTNILILDEPSDSLDPATARGFAEGIKKMGRLGQQIFVMTHNTHVESVLQTERQLLVEKKDGRAKVIGC